MTAAVSADGSGQAAGPGRLAGKVAIVTGAARYRGIGRAIALRLAADGADVVVTGRAADPTTFPAHEIELGWQGSASVAAEIEAMGRRALAIDFDVSDRDACHAAVDRVVAELGTVDLLVNNAALPSQAGAAPILDMDDELWQRTLDVNLTGVYHMTRAAGRVMRAAAQAERDGGGELRDRAIVNLSSTAGRQGLPNYGGYTATKFAVIGLTQQLAAELAPWRIRVNCVCPGTTDTDMMDGTFGRTAVHHGVAAEAPRRAAVRSVPLGRQGRAEEQAAAVSFLCSGDASYITGQTVNVDGGLRMD